MIVDELDISADRLEFLGVGVQTHVTSKLQHGILVEELTSLGIDRGTEGGIVGLDLDPKVVAHLT